MTESANAVSNYSYEEIPDLSGKYALVTGANQGIGYHTTLGLVSHGAHVTMACRTESKANEAIEQLHKDVVERYPHSKAAAQIAKGQRLPLDFLQLDLNDLKKTQESAQEYLSRGLPLHILINNSGIANEPWKLSADGIEVHFAVNHLGQFVFTNALLDRLKESQPSRIVVVRYCILISLTHAVEGKKRRLCVLIRVSIFQLFGIQSLTIRQLRHFENQRSHRWQSNNVCNLMSIYVDLCMMCAFSN